MQEAQRQSLEGDEMPPQRLADRALVSDRLRAMGLQRVATEAYGDCQFIAISETGGLGKSPAEMRKAVVKHMAERRFEYEDFIHNLSFRSYLARMQRIEKEWGDNLTLVAFSHMLKRPIHLVTNRSDLQYVEIITPPPDISRNEWGTPIVLAYYGEWHYEATAVL